MNNIAGNKYYYQTINSFHPKIVYTLLETATLSFEPPLSAPSCPSSYSFGVLSIRMAFVPFNPGILAMSWIFRIVPFSLMAGLWLRLIKLVSLCVILIIVPVNGNVVRISDAFWMAPIWIGAMPVSTCPLIFVWTGNGISPRSKWLPFECAS